MSSHSIGNIITIGCRTGYILDIDDGYLWIVYTHHIVNGKLKPLDNTKIYNVKEELCAT